MCSSDASTAGLDGAAARGARRSGRGRRDGRRGGLGGVLTGRGGLRLDAGGAAVVLTGSGLGAGARAAGMVVRGAGREISSKLEVSASSSSVLFLLVVLELVGHGRDGALLVGHCSRGAAQGRGAGLGLLLAAARGRDAGAGAGGGGGRLVVRGNLDGRIALVDALQIDLGRHGRLAIEPPPWPTRRALMPVAGGKMSDWKVSARRGTVNEMGSMWVSLMVL